MGDAVEVVHGAINGIDNPLGVAGLIAGVAFLALDAVVRKSLQQDAGDEFLAADIKVKLDVVLEHLIDHEIGAEIFALEFARSMGGFDGDLEQGHWQG